MIQGGIGTRTDELLEQVVNLPWDAPSSPTPRRRSNAAGSHPATSCFWIGVETDFRHFVGTTQDRAKQSLRGEERLVPETLDTADEIKTIRFRIESIETTQHLLLRGQSKELIKDLLWLFSRDRKLALVYLSLGKQRNQGEIVEHLKNAEGVAISQPTVSRKLSKLEEEGLIEKVGADASGTRWGRKKVVEQVLRLSRLVAEQAKTPKK